MIDLLPDREPATIEARLHAHPQSEGQINRLKTLKRNMYGRAHIELLKALDSDPMNGATEERRNGRTAPELIQKPFFQA